MTVTNDDLELALNAYGVTGQVTSSFCGPSLQVVDVQFLKGTRIKNITKLGPDLSLHLGTPQIKIEPLEGTTLIRFEIPLKERRFLNISQIISEEIYEDNHMALPVLLGLDMKGLPVLSDISSWPHALLGGSTGAGKSVLLHSIIYSLLFRLSPQEITLYLIDPKEGTEFGVYEGLHHLGNGHKPVTSRVDVGQTLYDLAMLMNERYKVLSAARTRDIGEYNEMNPETPMKRIVVIIDELADLMVEFKASLAPYLQMLTQKARAAGIHLILCTQRPTASIIPGDIKTNCAVRIALQMRTQIDSQVILDEGGAEKLTGKGDMLYLHKGVPQRLQGVNVSPREIEELVYQLRLRGEG